MSKADVYRLRLKGLLRRMKNATRTDRSVMQKKANALAAMAINEEWLEGKIEKGLGAVASPDTSANGFQPAKRSPWQQKSG